jgi:Mrp family chromosome partitioning ATPase
MILNAGKPPPNPSELLGSTRMRELIEALAEAADWVIIDSAPVLAVADAAAVARWADAALVVTKSGSSNRGAARAAKEALTNVGARIVGAVVWGLEAHDYTGSYGYGAYEAYQHPSAEAPPERAPRARHTKSMRSKGEGGGANIQRRTNA